MKPKSISGVVQYVADISKTADFYEALGFRLGDRSETYLKVYVNWFWMEFVQIDSENKSEFMAEAQAGQKGAGQFVGVNVDGVDDYYAQLVEKGFKPSSEPRDWPYGRREFVIRDPDGYKLVIFEKK